jgi:hypothetical protein
MRNLFAGDLAVPRTPKVGRRDRVYEQKVNGGGPLLTMATRKGSLKITEK